MRSVPDLKTQQLQHIRISATLVISHINRNHLSVYAASS